MNVGDMLELKGKTHKGKNRVSECGALWLVEHIDTIGNRGVFIRALSDWRHFRWVEPENDPDFDVKVVGWDADNVGSGAGDQL